MPYQPAIAKLPAAAPQRTSSFKSPPIPARPYAPAAAEKPKTPSLDSLTDFPTLPSKNTVVMPVVVAQATAKPSFAQIAKDGLALAEARAQEEANRATIKEDGMETLTMSSWRPGTPEFGRFERALPSSNQEDTPDEGGEYYDGGETWND
jgi:hypothetical protein